MSTNPEPSPNIDQRLEALTHSVELLAHMHKETEKDLRSVTKELRQLGKYIRTVARLVLDHEARLRVIEGEDSDAEEE